MKKVSLFKLHLLSMVLILSAGCSGFSRLPEINFVGKSGEEVLKISAQNPEKSHDGSINLMIPVSPHNPLHCNGNVYFKTAEAALADERIQKAPAVGVYRTARFMAMPGKWDYCTVIFDQKNVAVSQKKTSYYDGL